MIVKEHSSRRKKEGTQSAEVMPTSRESQGPASGVLCQSVNPAPIYYIFPNIASSQQPLMMSGETESPQLIVPTNSLSENSLGVPSKEKEANPHSSGTGVISGLKSRQATQVIKAFLTWGWAVQDTNVCSPALGILWDSCGESTRGAPLIQSGWKGSALKSLILDPPEEFWIRPAARIHCWEVSTSKLRQLSV